MKLVAITGSIGCGKTTISDILRSLGYLVYDIDKWVRHLYYRADFLAVIRKKFPEVFVGNVFDKKKLRELVFDNPARLRELEALIHPFLTQKLRRIIRKRVNKGIVFIDVALLFELKWDKFCYSVVLADTDYETQKQRVMRRDNISAEDFDKINKQQMPREVKKMKADIIIDTGVSKNKLRRNVVELVRVLEDGEY